MPSTMVLTLILIGFLAALAQAATVTYDFNFTWVHAYPDGAFDRPVIGINNQWPLPMIEGTVGDEIVVSVHNQLGNRSTSLHFHGLYQNRTNFMDGAVGATQCLIPPGSTVQYKFNVWPVLPSPLKVLTRPAQSNGHVLVPRSQRRPVPGRPPRTPDHPRP